MVKQTRYAATKIANSLKLTTLQSGYDSNNEEILEDEPPWVDLLQNNSKVQKAKASCSSTANTASASQANPEGEEANIFESLVSMTWKKDVAGKEPADQEHDPATTAQASTARTKDPAPSTAA